MQPKFQSKSNRMEKEIKMSLEKKMLQENLTDEKQRSVFHIYRKNHEFQINLLPDRARY